MLEVVCPAPVELLEGQRTAILDLFQQRYGVQPWNESPAANAKAVDEVVAAARLATTRSAVALSGARVLVGLGQGGPGENFLSDLRAVAPDRCGDVDGPTFELWQLTVMEAAGGAGLGGALHDAVMGDVSGPALLLTHPLAVAAGYLYERRGWRKVARISFGPDHPRDIWRRYG